MNLTLVIESSKYFLFLGYQKGGDKSDTISGKTAIRGACGQDCTTHFVPGDEEQSVYQLYNTTRWSHEPKNFSLHEKGWESHVICLDGSTKSQIELVTGKPLLKSILACGPS